MDFEEFLRFLRHIEPSYFNGKKIIKIREIFDKFSDENDDDEQEVFQDKVLKLIGFKKMCLDEGLFTEEGQIMFLEEGKRTGISMDFPEIVENWISTIRSKIMIAMRFVESDALQMAVSKLEALVLNSTEKDERKVMINFRILEAEIARGIHE